MAAKASLHIITLILVSFAELLFWTPAHATAITLGTTAATSVSISGDAVNANHQLLYIYLQTAAGTPTASNTIPFDPHSWRIMHRTQVKGDARPV
jgi:hypothetical protein